MLLKFHSPRYPLSDFVELMVFYEDAYQENVIQRLLPDGAANLLIELDNIPKYTFHNDSLAVKSKYARSWVSGMQQEYISIGASAHASMLVIRFKPTGAYAIIGIPMHELSNRVIDADLVFGSEVHTLRDQLLEATSAERKFEIAERWLMNRCRSQHSGNNAIVHAVKEISRTPTLERISQLTQATGYSQKQFIHLFKTQVGITPKYFQRVMRFNLILDEIERDNSINWTRLSHQCGFYDQAHFIREFRQFSGFNPGEFLKEEREYKNYVVVG